MYCLRVFVLQELHCLPNCLHTCIIRVRGCYHAATFRCPTLSSFLVKIQPEAVYCYFTRTTLFTTMFTVIIVVCSSKSMCIPSFFRLLWECYPCSYRNVWPEAVYCCFTRTTLFTELFTYLYNQSERLLSCRQGSLPYTFQFLS